MIKRRSNILKDNFFEEGGISRNAFFIFFIAFLMCIQVGVSFKSEDVMIQIRESEKKLFALKQESDKYVFENTLSRSEISELLADIGSDLQPPDTSPRYLVKK